VFRQAADLLSLLLRLGYEPQLSSAVKTKHGEIAPIQSEHSAGFFPIRQMKEGCISQLDTQLPVLLKNCREPRQVCFPE